MAKAQRATHPKCGKKFPYGDRTGHCSGCCETFYGVSTFDRHRRNTDDGDRICLDPADTPDLWRKDEEDRWHYGAELSTEEKARIWSRNDEEDA